METEETKEFGEIEFSGPLAYEELKDLFQRAKHDAIGENERLKKLFTKYGAICDGGSLLPLDNAVARLASHINILNEMFRNLLKLSDHAPIAAGDIADRIASEGYEISTSARQISQIITNAIQEMNIGE